MYDMYIKRNIYALDFESGIRQQFYKSILSAI